MKVFLLSLLVSSTSFAQIYTITCTWNDLRGLGDNDEIVVDIPAENFAKGSGDVKFQYSQWSSPRNQMVVKKAHDVSITYAQLAKSGYSFRLLVSNNEMLTVSSKIKFFKGNAKLEASFREPIGNRDQVTCMMIDGFGYLN